jgi:hypothetical protein
MVRRLLTVSLLVKGLAAASPSTESVAEQIRHRGPWPSLEAMCRAHAERIGPSLAQEGSPDHLDAIPAPHCVPGRRVEGFVARGLLLDARLYEANDEKSHYTALALRAPSGWYLADARFENDSHDDPHCSAASWVTIGSAEVAQDGGTIRTLTPRGPRRTFSPSRCPTPPRIAPKSSSVRS